MYKVAVLMSTYNGEKYLKEQIDSILAQKKVDITLFIRDDGSSDNTVKILDEFSQNDSRIHYYKGNKNLGACGSFLELISGKYDENYFALSDQDDVWDEDKVIIAIQKLQTLPQGMPTLYYSNLRIVDQNLNYLRESHVKPMIPGAKYSYLSDVLVTGCTAVFNKELQRIAMDIKPQTFSMHDTWLYVVASIFGNCIYDFTSHMSYRQHANNVIGARKRRFSFESLKREFCNYFDWGGQPRFRCALEIKKQFANLLDKKTSIKIDEFVHYKDTILSTLKLAFDKELNSENLYRSLRFKIKVLLRNV